MQDSLKQWEQALYAERPTLDEFYLNASFFRNQFRNFSTAAAASNHKMKRPGNNYGLLLGQTDITTHEMGCQHLWVPAIVGAFSNPNAIMIFRRDDNFLYHQFERHYRRWLQHGLLRATIIRAEYGSSEENVIRCSNAEYLSRVWESKMESTYTARGMAIETFQSPLILLAFGCTLGGILLTAELASYVRRKRRMHINQT